jgi:hypothetical protein
MIEQKVLDVVPADLPDMDYATSQLVHGYQVRRPLVLSQNITLIFSHSSPLL